MEFFSFVDYGFDVRAFKQSDLANDELPFLLLFSEVVVRNMSNGLKTSWKVNVIGFLRVVFFGEPV